MSGERRLPLEQALLGFLMREPMHGYDLHQCIQEELGEIWYVGISNVYGTLKRLEQSGRVESRIVSQEDRPSRKDYHITPAGERSFLDWLRQPVASIRDIRVEFLAKLYFFRALDREGVEDLIAGQEAICRELVERLEERKAQCSPHDLDRLVFDFRRCQTKAVLDWLLGCRKQFVGGKA